MLRRRLLRRILLLKPERTSGTPDTGQPLDAAEVGRRLAELRPALLAFVRGKIGNDADAQEIVSETILRAYGRASDLREPERLRGWLFRIARNLVADHYRSTHVPLRSPVSLPDEMPAPEPDDPRTTLQSLANCLGTFSENLPDSYAEAVELADMVGLPQREVASRLGLSLSGAKSRIQRGRKLLERAIRDCCHIEFDARGRPVDHWPHRCTACGC